jgi:hypothetical protein
MLPCTLTVLAPIRPGEVEPLRAILRPIGDDIRGRRLAERPGQPRIEFQQSRRIHFARFAVLADPDRGPDRHRLLYSASFDGGLDDHLAELTAITSDMEAIWGRLEGYPGAAGFGRFIRAHAHEPGAFYIAFRDASVESVRNGAPAARPGAIARLLRAVPIVADVARAFARFGIANVVRGGQRIVACLDRYPLFRITNRLTRNRMPPMQSPYSSVALDNCVVAGPLPPSFREDVVTQNQLTLVTAIRPGLADRAGSVLAAIDGYAQRLAPPGSLIGISTIHFVKWLVIDDGRRLMMVSDYDGSWESYIDEFAEMILSGLDAIWETAYGYPPDGARDLPAFKRFLRSHQVPAEVFFSAYPDKTILNIVNDRGRS